MTMQGHRHEHATTDPQQKDVVQGGNEQVGSDLFFVLPTHSYWIMNLEPVAAGHHSELRTYGCAERYRAETPSLNVICSHSSGVHA